MAKMVNVPRAEILRLLGLSSDVDDETLNTAIEAALSRQKTREAAGAEERLRAEDRRLVNAAYNEGKIVNRDNWVAALAANRQENRAVLASLAPGLPPEQRVAVGEELQTVMGRLGITSPAGAPPPRRVAASSYQAPVPSSRPAVDMVGLPIPPLLPPPVLISKGTPPAQWTERQRQDAMLRRLGPRFHPGTEPPPAQDVWYQPGPNDHSVYVEGEGWRENPNYRPRA